MKTKNSRAIYCLMIVSCMCLIAIAAGCAKTTVTQQQIQIAKIPKPATIWVHDFAATPQDLPPHSSLAGQYAEPAKPQTAEHIAMGRKMGAMIAQEVTDTINVMGMHAVHASMQERPALNDIVLQGYLVSFDEGSEWKRIVIGFNEGNTDLKAGVEGFQMTSGGLRRISAGATDAKGSEGPGGAVGGLIFLATHNPLGLIVNTGLKVYGEESGRDTVEGRAKQTADKISDILKDRFQEQGWIPASK
jgi:hypothetical protein